MVIIENKELEEFALSPLSCFAVPVEVFVPTCGEPTVFSYSVCERESREWEEKYKGRLLSDEALEDLHNSFEAVVKKLSLERVPNENEWMMEYVFTPDMHLPKSDSAVKVHMISSNAVLSKICEISGCDIEIADDGEDVVFAVVDEGRLLAYAGMNDVKYEDNSVEISVETAPEHRRCGYGIACVAALTKHLTGKGIAVRYKCSRENSASSALAEKCGFELEGERFSFVCERI